MEFLAVLIGTRLLTFVVYSQLDCNVAQYLWTDNKAVLDWINNSQKGQERFVQNPLLEIRKVQYVQLNYILSMENPADIATRGTKNRYILIN